MSRVGRGEACKKRRPGKVVGGERSVVLVFGKVVRRRRARSSLVKGKVKRGG